MTIRHRDLPASAMPFDQATFENLVTAVANELERRAKAVPPSDDETADDEAEETEDTRAGARVRDGLPVGQGDPAA